MQQQLQQQQNEPQQQADANLNNQQENQRELSIVLKAANLQVDVDHYDRPAISGDPEKWIKRFEIMTNEMQWSDEKRTCRLPAYLTGLAKKWFNHCKENDWPTIRTAFITHFSSLFGERTEYETYSWDQQEPLMKFIDAKEEKATAAGMPANQAIKHLIGNSGLPFQFAMCLAGREFKSFNEFKAIINEMMKLQQNRPPRHQVQPPFKSSYGRNHSTSAAKGRFNISKLFGGKPPICPECKTRGKSHHHWLSDCYYRQANSSKSSRNHQHNPRQTPVASATPRGAHLMEHEQETQPQQPNSQLN